MTSRDCGGRQRAVHGPGIDDPDRMDGTFDAM